MGSGVINLDINPGDLIEYAPGETSVTSLYASLTQTRSYGIVLDLDSGLRTAAKLGIAVACIEKQISGHTLVYIISPHHVGWDTATGWVVIDGNN